MAKADFDIDDYMKLCQVMADILMPGFGPNGLNTLVCSSTGKLMVTNCGRTVLQALQFSHPVGGIITSAVQANHKETGDNSKTFVLMLNAMLREMKARSSRENRKYSKPEVYLLAREFGELVHAVLPNFLNIMEKYSTCIPFTDEQHMWVAIRNIAGTSLSGKFPLGTSGILTDLTVSFIQASCREITQLESCLTDIISNFDNVCFEYPNQILSASQVMEGYLVQKDFTDHNMHRLGDQVNFLLLDCSLDGSTDEPSSCPTIMAKNESVLIDSLKQKHNFISAIMQILIRLRINLIITTECMTDLAKHHCRKNGLHCLESVSPDQIQHISCITGTHILHTLSEFALPGCVGQVQSCQRVQIGSSMYVHLQGIERKTQFASHFLILKGPTPGLCYQYARAVFNCLKCIRAACKAVHWTNPEKCPDDNKTRNYENITALDLNNSKDAGHRGNKDIPVILSQGNTNDGRRLVLTPGGATFEFSLIHSAREYVSRNYGSKSSSALKILEAGLLSVPRALLQNSFMSSSKRSFVENIRKEFDQRFEDGQLWTMDGRTGQLCDPAGGSAVEPVSSKIQLLLKVTQLLLQLVKIDTAISVRKLPSRDGDTDGESGDDCDDDNDW